MDHKFNKKNLQQSTAISCTWYIVKLLAIEWYKNDVALIIIWKNS